MMDKPKEGKRYPLEHKPLRNPGESIRAEMDRLLQEEILSYAVAAFYMIVFTILEWIRWFFRAPPQPIAITIVTLLAIGYIGYRFVVVRRQYEALRLGWEGEKFVGQYLETLRSQGCRVFHDIVGKGFNIDHVVVSTRGVFVIETKTYSKPMRGKAVVEFDGERILVNGIEPERNAISQVRALGNWLRDLLVDSTGHRYPIKGAVILPGWFVELRTKNKSDVWVLNHKALPSFIEHEPEQLKTEEVALIASRLVTYMQTVE